MEVVEWIKTLSGAFIVPSIGVQSSDLHSLGMYITAGADAVCIDIAHGDSKQMVDQIKEIKINFPTIKIIAGNVATGAGALRLAEAGANAIKVGVGPGSMCTTRVVTGHGMPQLFAVNDVYHALKGKDVDIIADGGIRNSGDVVKALAFGANMVMLGSMLAGTEETPGEKIQKGIDYGITFWKEYRGMASREAQENFRGKVSNGTPEGVKTIVKYKGPVKDVIDDLAGGLRSGLSYSGVDNIIELQRMSCYVIVTQAAYIEGTPHGTK